MRDDQKAMLEDMREKTLDNAIEEFNEACAMTLQDKDQRGDRRWLTMMASSSIKLYKDLTSILDQDKPSGVEEEDEDKAIREAIQKAQGRVMAFEQRKG